MYKAKTELNFLLDAIPVPSLSYCHHVAVGELDEKILNESVASSREDSLSMKYDFLFIDLL